MNIILLYGVVDLGIRNEEMRLVRKLLGVVKVIY